MDQPVKLPPLPKIEFHDGSKSPQIWFSAKETKELMRQAVLADRALYGRQQEPK